MNQMIPVLIALCALFGCAVMPDCNLLAKVESLKHFKSDVVVKSLPLKSDRDVASEVKDGVGFICAGREASSTMVLEIAKEMMASGAVREICFVVCNKGGIDGIFYTAPSPNGEIDFVAGKGGGNLPVIPNGNELKPFSAIHSNVNVFIMEKPQGEKEEVLYLIDVSADPKWGDVVECIDRVVDLGGGYHFRK